MMKAVRSSDAVVHFNEADFAERMRGMGFRKLSTIKKQWRLARLGKLPGYKPSTARGEPTVAKMAPHTVEKSAEVQRSQKSHPTSIQKGEKLRLRNKDLDAVDAAGLLDADSGDSDGEEDCAEAEGEEEEGEEEGDLFGQTVAAMQEEAEEEEEESEEEEEEEEEAEEEEENEEVPEQHKGSIPLKRSIISVHSSPQDARPNFPRRTWPKALIDVCQLWRTG